jgi:hypothetical protein
MTFKESVMKKLTALAAAMVCLSVATGTLVHANGNARTLVVTMTNDVNSNLIQVYDAESHALLQTLSTRGKGGAGGNARGVRQLDGTLVAAVNNGSNSVAIFRRDGDALKFDRLVTTTSAPVSVDFGNDHLYVAGATTVDSFAMHAGTVEWPDGTADLRLANGTTPPGGSTAQVGVVGDTQLLVTLKADPDPGTVDVIALDAGRVIGTAPVAVSAPDGTLTPFGFAAYPDGTALITLAHSNQDALFRDGSFAAVVPAGQAASCWMARDGKFVFVANTGSRTLSRLIGTGSHVFVDNAVAATVATGGGPSDVDASSGVLGVIDHGAGQSHLSLFTYNVFGELTAAGAPITLGVPDANGVAILSAPGARHESGEGR